MKTGNKKREVSLGIRIGILFLMTVITIIMVAYYMIFQNVHKMMADYTIKLVQAMTDQGVELVETELEVGKKEASFLAGSLEVPVSDEAVVFPKAYAGSGNLRMLYVSERGTESTDGRQRDVKNRPDIVAAYNGETAIYGPYFNEEQEFVICYTAPVRQGDNIVGVLSVEKDGYRFCELIKSIRFVNSGESYIINAEGTDIAVSDQNHIDWVNSQYNGRKLYKEEPDEETKSIIDLEAKGLNGETGVGTYYWKDGLVYVIYQPIPSVNWVLFGGLRDEEIAAMTQSAVLASISKGPTLVICLFIFLLLTGLIIFWIISSMKKTSEINDKLEIIANHDALTGLLNRRFLESSLSELWKFPIKLPSQAVVIMIDIDDFKKYNDYYGHPQGDDCLRHVADVFKAVVDGFGGSVMRYGGEEFIAVIFQMDRQSAIEIGQKICRQVEDQKLPNSQGRAVTVSVGVCHVNSTLESSLSDCIQNADKALYQAKKEGKNRAVIFE